MDSRRRTEGSYLELFPEDFGERLSVSPNSRRYRRRSSPSTSASRATV